jgi:lysophospholipid acyltransferase (LPLAT)-like uncharacterized protein
MLNKLKKVWKRLEKRFLRPIYAYIALGIMRLILFTCRIKVNGLSNFISTASKEKCILMLWHNRMTIVPYILSKYTSSLIFSAFISNSRDGEMLAAIVRIFSRGRTIRVPHNTKHQALKELIRRLEDNKEIVIITPDGPRGPRYQIKPGIVLAAREASAYVIPLTWVANRFWQLNTWDKLMIPKPFSTIKVSFGSAIQVQENSTEERTQELNRLQEGLAVQEEKLCSEMFSNKDHWPH